MSGDRALAIGCRVSGREWLRLLPPLLGALLACAAPPAAEQERAARRQALRERGRVRKWPRRPWRSAYQLRTRNYTVRTNTSYQVARYIGEVMEMTASRYREIFGLRFGAIPHLTINAYATRAEYEAAADRAGFAAGITAGFYSPRGRGAIHLPYQLTRGVHPAVVLFHEGTHQFVHQVIDYRLPLVLKSRVPKRYHLLVSTPIWLNEGLASYMETAYYDGDKIVLGRINRMRLAHLQKLLRARTNPAVSEVLGRRYGQPFGAAHYAVAWGLVYLLRHRREQQAQASSRRRLARYVDACKRGFYALPQAGFARDFLVGGKLPGDFDVRWNVRIGHCSLEWFRKIFLARGQSLEQWETAWRRRVLALELDKPCGGLPHDETDGAGLHR